jgi:hypothetical protein
MRCTYSVRTTKALTFRVYRCDQCGWQKETAELPMGLFEELTNFNYLEMLKQFRGSRQLKMKISRAVQAKRKAVPPHAEVS